MSSTLPIRSLRDIFAGAFAPKVSDLQECPLVLFLVKVPFTMFSHTGMVYVSLHIFLFQMKKTGRKKNIDSGPYAVASQPPNLNLMLHQTRKRWCILVISLQVGSMDGSRILIKLHRLVMNIFDHYAYI